MATIPPDLEVEIKSAEENLVKAKIQLAKAEEYLGALELSRSIVARHLEKVEEES